MDKTVNSTKKAAENILSELPSVVGAFVREDVRGNPRDVHLLVRPGPRPRDLAYDVHDLLEEHLGVDIDQRVISIAQISSSASERIKETYRQRLMAGTMGNDTSETQMPSGPSSSQAATRPAEHPPAAQQSNGSRAPAPNGPSAAMAARRREEGSSAVPSERFEEHPAEEGNPNPNPWPRLIFKGVDTATRESEVRVRVRLAYDGEVFRGEAVELDVGGGRARAAASATLEAIRKACGEARFDAEVVTIVPALGRQYVLVGVLALSSATGRRPLDLAGAHPAGDGIELAASYAALKATNRFVGLVLADRIRG